MDKKKFDMKNYADAHKEKVCKANDGTEVIVRDHIAYADKEKMAEELLENTIVIHEDSCVYTASHLDKEKFYLMAKYYTNIDTEGEDLDDVVNYLINTDVIGEIKDFVEHDMDFVMVMYWSLYDALVAVYTDDNSLSKALRTSFGFLFNGEDITQTLAKAEATKDTMYEAYNLLNQKEKERAENIDKGTLTIGGNIINFAKKEE